MMLKNGLTRLTMTKMIKDHKNWPYIPDHPYRILIIGGSESGKTNLLSNLIESQSDPYESKFHY